MDPCLKEMCLEILAGDVDGERFAKLLIETGIHVDTFEWDIVNKLLNQGDEIRYRCKFGYALQ